jgi:hypothetical protein
MRVAIPPVSLVVVDTVEQVFDVNPLFGKVDSGDKAQFISPISTTHQPLRGVKFSSVDSV